MFKKSLLGAMLVAGSLIGALPMAANAQYSATVRIAPPPPLHEVVPEPRSGFIWAPGHYEWRGDQYVWMRGHWMPQRYGYEYREPRWVQRGNGEWYLVGGDWVQRDDYAQNRRYGYERRHRHLNGPYGDRDGDGVLNRYDRFPNDPDRS
jgi:hypothetical protein